MDWLERNTKAKHLLMTLEAEGKNLSPNHQHQILNSLEKILRIDIGLFSETRQVR